jgi:carbon storage regulator
MLVITRRRDEAVVIGDGIEVRVLRVGREGVRLGVSAPSQVRVHRREIYDLIRDENRVAAQTRRSSPAVIEKVRRSTETVTE